MNILSKKFLFIRIVIISLLATSCVTLTSDITTQSHANPDVNFNSYKSYSWAGSAQIVFDPVGQWEQPTLDTDEEVKFNINTELREQGLIEVSADPDLMVAFAVGIDMAHLKLVENPESKEKVLTNIPKAALVIALIDVDSGYTVWMGFAEGNVQSQQTIENIRARIEYAVHEIFKSYNN